VTRRRIGDKAKQIASYARKERAEAVVAEYLKGKPVSEIAKKFGLNPWSVYDDLKIMRRIWHKRNNVAADKLIAEEVARLSRVETEAWEQWERSKKAAKEKTVTRKLDMSAEEPDPMAGADGFVTEEKQTTKGRLGDPRYLDIAMRAVDKRCRLLQIGEYAPKDQPGVLVGQLVEVVVSTPEQVKAMMNYQEYQELTLPNAEE